MFAVMLTHCIVCEAPFSCNPVRVPSLRINGVKEAICKNCFERRQRYRESIGKPRETYADDAYSPVDCDEVNEARDEYAEQADAEAQFYQEENQ